TNSYIQSITGDLEIDASAGDNLVLKGDAITLNGVNATDFARLSQANTFTALQTVQLDGAGIDTKTAAGTDAAYFRHFDSDAAYLFNRLNEPIHLGTNNTTRLTIGADGNFD